MTGPKTNEREGTRAVLRHARLSPVQGPRGARPGPGSPGPRGGGHPAFLRARRGLPSGQALRSAVANAENNDDLDPEELYVSACYADEGPTIKRWRPRARGRATRIRKRTTHVTVIVSRLSEEELARLRAHRRAEQLAQRSRRVSLSRRSRAIPATGRIAGVGYRSTNTTTTTEEGAESRRPRTEAVDTEALEAEAARYRGARSRGGREPRRLIPRRLSPMPSIQMLI